MLHGATLVILAATLWFTAGAARGLARFRRWAALGSAPVALLFLPAVGGDVISAMLGMASIVAWAHAITIARLAHASVGGERLRAHPMREHALALVAVSALALAIETLRGELVLR